MIWKGCGESRGGEDEAEDSRGARRPHTRRGEIVAGGGGRAIVEEELCATSGSGEEEREPGWEKVWSRGGICGGVSSCSPRRPEMERAWKLLLRLERLFLEGRSGGAGLRGGNTGFSSKQEVREEAEVEEGDAGGR